MKLVPTLAMVVTAMVLAACGKHGSQQASSSDALVGTFGAIDTKTGAVRPLVKIEANGEGPSGYALYEYGKSGWRRPVKAWDASKSPEPVKAFTVADLEKQVHHKVDVPVSGVQVPSFAFVHVPAGWSDSSDKRAFTTKTGYFALTLLGPIELVRMETN